MNGPVVGSIADLHEALQEAVALEFATIPPYLCGWLSVLDSSMQAAELIQSVLIVEMRHLSVAANTLIATGGIPNIVAAVPSYPTYLPDGEDEFQVSLVGFGLEFLQQSMWIEQPTTPDELPAEVLARFASGAPPPRRHRVLAMGQMFPTIGQFYQAIIDGIQFLVATLGEAEVFPDGARTALQFGYFGPQKITVSGLDDAGLLLTDIIDEGEGSTGQVWDENGDLAHYYSFQEISLGRAYVPGDAPGAPSGGPILMPGANQVAPMATNPTMADYLPEGSPLWNAADAFNQLFAAIVNNLGLGFTGALSQLDAALGQMLQLPVTVAALWLYPMPGQAGLVAGPTFELPPYSAT